MSSQLLLYSTVGEFRENSSDVSAYMSTTVRPAPARITTRFVVRAVVRTTIQSTLTSRYWGHQGRTEVGHTFPADAQLRPLFLRLHFV